MTIPGSVTDIKSPMSATDLGIVMFSKLQLQKAKSFAKDKHSRKIRKCAFDGKLVE